MNSSGSTDSGVSSRVFGNIITWMQERKRPVFLVLTANRVDAIPPEFLRAGRLDKVFFVDLPTSEERKEIFQIHLQKRGRRIDVPEEVILATNGYSGAEIESVVVEALYSAFDRLESGEEGADVTGDDLLEGVKAVIPLSETRKDDINRIRSWAKENKAEMASKVQTETFVPKRRVDYI